MRELSIWLDAHCSRGDLGVFRSAAELADAGTSDLVHSVGSGRELYDLVVGLRAEGLRDVDHLVIAGHGGTTWILDDEHGVTSGMPQHQDQIHVYELASVLEPILSREALISLAACLCSRSPRWYLRWRLGRRIGSDWGRRAYLPGGEASFSARLRDALCWYGVDPRVRGHRAAGHATALALLAEHGWPAGSPCDTLYLRVHPELEPSRPVRRRWVELVTGRLAQRWLMGDDDVPDEIRRRW